MKAEFVTVDPEHIEAGFMEQAGAIIKTGGLVAFPTETVYGLGGDALNADSSRKIYAAKGRPSDNPLIVHICEWKALHLIAANVPASAAALARRFWPGPLTMIFEKTQIVPYETTGGLETVAVRMPSHPVAAAFIRASGGYVAAPSANLSGRPSPTTALHVKEDLEGRIDLIIDSGSSHIGLESTIVDFTEDIPVILRPGYINPEMLREVLGEVRMDPGILSENEKVRPKAPGMRYRHYAPKAPLSIVAGQEDAVIERINALTAEKEKRIGIICAAEHLDQYRNGIVKCAGSFANEEEIARNLYRILREFDEEKVDAIYSEAFDTPGLGSAIMNRLLKAAGHTVITL